MGNIDIWQDSGLRGDREAGWRRLGARARCDGTRLEESGRAGRGNKAIGRRGPKMMAWGREGAWGQEHPGHTQDPTPPAWHGRRAQSRLKTRIQAPMPLSRLQLSITALTRPQRARGCAVSTFVPPSAGETADAARQDGSLLRTGKGGAKGSWPEATATASRFQA